LNDFDLGHRISERMLCNSFRIPRVGLKRDNFAFPADNASRDKAENSNMRTHIVDNEAGMEVRRQHLFYERFVPAPCISIFVTRVKIYHESAAGTSGDRCPYSRARGYDALNNSPQSRSDERDTGRHAISLSEKNVAKHLFEHALLPILYLIFSA
jgi:hypothetical protein